MLHDIGWTTGINSHHKRSADLIRNSNLPFTSIERELTAQIARYHRKSVPSLSHKSFSLLSYEDKQRIKILSSILRIADGLDNNHEQKTTDIICKITRKNILIQLISDKDPHENIEAAIKKSDYMVELLGRTITFKWKKENK
jgi:exopolyphosphatase/guanosine-5'-triphosphate,3'-diphosphate pyrophosphatase